MHCPLNDRCGLNISCLSPSAHTASVFPPTLALTISALGLFFTDTQQLWCCTGYSSQRTVAISVDVAIADAAAAAVHDLRD